VFGFIFGLFKGKHPEIRKAAPEPLVAFIPFAAFPVFDTYTPSQRSSLWGETPYIGQRFDRIVD
jgi:hypothetical protein